MAWRSVQIDVIMTLFFQRLLFHCLFDYSKLFSISSPLLLMSSRFYVWPTDKRFFRNDYFIVTRKTSIFFIEDFILWCDLFLFCSVTIFLLVYWLGFYTEKWGKTSVWLAWGRDLFRVTVKFSLLLQVAPHSGNVFLFPMSYTQSKTFFFVWENNWVPSSLFFSVFSRHLICWQYLILVNLQI